MRLRRLLLLAVLWVTVSSRELYAYASRVYVRACVKGGAVVSVNEVNASVDEADVEAFRNMRPSVVITLDDAEHEEFMRIVDGAGEPVPDERLARLFDRPSPFGRHVDV